MSETEAEVTQPTEELSDESTGSNDPPVHLEDPKIGSITIKLRKLFPDMYVDAKVEPEPVGKDKVIEDGGDKDINEIPKDEEEEEHSEEAPRTVLPYPVTEAARVRAEACQRLDELMARQAEDEIKMIEDILVRQQEERLVEDEKAKNDMKNIHGLDWGRQIPKRRLLLEKIREHRSSLSLRSVPSSKPSSSVERCSLSGFIQATGHPEEVTIGASLRPIGKDEEESVELDYITIASNDTSLNGQQQIHYIQHFIDAGIPAVDHSSSRSTAFDRTGNKCKEFIIRYGIDLELRSNINKSAYVENTIEDPEKWTLAVIAHEATVAYTKNGRSIVELGHHQVSDTMGTTMSSWITFYMEKDGFARLAGLRSSHIGFYEKPTIKVDELDDLKEHGKLLRLKPSEDAVDLCIRQGIQYGRYIYKGLSEGIWQRLSRNQPFTEGADMLSLYYNQRLAVRSIVKSIWYKLTGARGMMLNETSSTSLIVQRLHDGIIVNHEV
ncbi:hypothetical protein FOL47_007917 [Perkinsus chesapeaki]|uniref:Uncharacterized protein n=1 Tax=Perkinsus chesapeaki TaxID=330153 RepID=A0A7J6LHE9_PERCH|nr:hypothetical protein FOL47_007917 [Perkinsus chesapeaki]